MPASRKLAFITSALLFVFGISYVCRGATVSEDIAQVKEVTWYTTTTQYVREIKHYSNWNSTPRGAFNVECARKQRGKQPCFCTKEGTACQVCPVSDTFCEYDTYHWKIVDSVEFSGQDSKPNWPNIPQVYGDDEKNTYEVSFRILFEKSNHDVVVYNPESLGEFNDFSIGDWWKFRTNSVGRFMPVRVIQKSEGK